MFHAHWFTICVNYSLAENPFKHTHMFRHTEEWEKSSCIPLLYFCTTQMDWFPCRFFFSVYEVTVEHSINIPKRQSIRSASLDLVAAQFWEHASSGSIESTRHLLICEGTPELILLQLLTHFLPPALISRSPFPSVLLCHYIFLIPSPSSLLLFHSTVYLYFFFTNT